MQTLARDRERVREWLYRLIHEFRERSDKLSDLEREYIAVSGDFRTPCQLEIFWMRNPEWQFFVMTRHEDREDLEIIINGPYEAYSFLDETEKIMQEERWKEQVPLSQEEEKYVGSMSYADCFGDILHSQILQIKNLMFRMRPETGTWGGFRLSSPGGWVQFIQGNIADLDRNEYLSRIFDYLRIRAKPVSQEESRKKQSPKKRYITGYGTYFYPPIWIGRMPKPTFRQRVHGSIGLPIFDKAFDCNFHQYRLVFNTDGLFAINSESRNEALQILNCILATAFLMGVESQTVRQNEIAKISFRPDGFTISGREEETPTLRTLLGEPLSERAYSLYYTQRVLSKQEILKIVSKAEKIFQEPKISEKAIFLLRANTHLTNSEHSQAFIFAWLLIERHIHELWQQFLEHREVSLPKSRTADAILRNLNRNNLLAKEEYNLLNRMRDERNAFVHKGETISRKMAEECIDFALSTFKKGMAPCLS